MTFIKSSLNINYYFKCILGSIDNYCYAFKIQKEILENLYLISLHNRYLLSEKLFKIKLMVP